MTSKNELFSELMRELEVEMGSRDLTDLVLNSLMEAIKTFKTKDKNDFCEQYDEFIDLVYNTEPKFGIFQYYFGELKKQISGDMCPVGLGDKWKKTAINKIKKTMKLARDERRKLLKFADEIDVEGKTILIHDHSHTVQDVLVHYKRMKKHFKVIIAEQDYEKTHDNIEMLHKAQISFTVVPAYMLSHLHNDIDMVFFGALTIKDTMDFVMNPGSHSIITEFHLEKTPIYMFLGTDKFSLWKSKPRGEIFIHQHTREHLSKPIIYKRTKYSHDRVPVKLFQKIITNEGVLNSEQIEKLFNEKISNNPQ